MRLGRRDVDGRVGELARLRPVDHLGVDLGGGDGHLQHLLRVEGGVIASSLARPAQRRTPGTFYPLDTPCAGSASGVLGDPGVHGDRGRRARVDRPGGAELGDVQDVDRGRRGRRRTARRTPGRTAARTRAAAGSPRAAPSRAGCRRRAPAGPLLGRPGDAGRRPSGGGGRAGSGRSPWRPRRFQRRLPTMCTSAARNAFAVRTTEPMLRSWAQFSIGHVERVPAGVEVRDDRLDRPVAVAVDDVAPVALGQQLGVVAGVVGGPRRPTHGPTPTSARSSSTAATLATPRAGHRRPVGADHRSGGHTVRTTGHGCRTAARTLGAC